MLEYQNPVHGVDTCESQNSSIATSVVQKHGRYGQMLSAKNAERHNKLRIRIGQGRSDIKLQELVRDNTIGDIRSFAVFVSQVFTQKLGQNIDVIHVRLSKIKRSFPSMSEQIANIQFAKDAIRTDWLVGIPTFAASAG